MAEDNKIRRDAFVYVQPSDKSYGDPKDYAQCGTCALWTGEKRNRCFILGKKLEVKFEHTCCLYTNSKPQVELLAEKEIPTYTAEQAGFYKGRVQCQRCIYFNPLASQCKLFFILQTEFPEDYDLKSKDGTYYVNRHGCCNSWIGKERADKEKDRE